MTKKARGDIPHPVVPRHASAEGPLADARGDKKRVARGDIPHPVVLRHASAEGPLADARGDKKGGSG